MLQAAGAAGSLLTFGAGAVRAAAPTVKTSVDFAVPPGACDCHVHIFDPAQFPYSPERVYTPPQASIADLRDLQTALHLERVVIVTPSVYGIDNSCTLDAIRKLGARARGVAVIGPSTTAAALDEMAAGGFRGVRLNFETAGESDPANVRRQLDAVAAQLRGRDWHIQLNTNLTVIAALKAELAALPMPIVVDHFGRARAKDGVDQPGLDALLDLMKAGKAYVKISAPYRVGTKAPDFPDALPIAQKIIAANPQRIVWGSNWPHPGRGAAAPRSRRPTRTTTAWCSTSCPNGCPILPCARRSWSTTRRGSTASRPQPDYSNSLNCPRRQSSAPLRPSAATRRPNSRPTSVCRE
jgi:predicted TIM-barrel fold metal-dependent hydrolase